MLDKALLDQLRDIFSSLNAQYTLVAEAPSDHPNADELFDLVSQMSSVSSHLHCTINKEASNLRLTIEQDGKDLGILFRAVPGGHEFSTLLLAILNADGKGKNLPDDAVRQRIVSLRGPIRIKSYISLSCTNCPDVVQAINVVTLLHPDAQHEIIDGGINVEEVDKLKLQGVPAVFVNDVMIHSGRGGMTEVLEALVKTYGINEDAQPSESEAKTFDLIVAGGGPAGCSAAIYAVRKGLKVALVADRMGGQVKDTVAIENLIATPQTTGAELAGNLRKHLENYPIDILEGRKIEKAEVKSGLKILTTSLGEILQTSALIIATGAAWRRLGIPGESEHIGNGVAFCPHCDGPFFKGKKIAVIGGGNSGVEAAIDLAGIVEHVSLIEFLPELRADKVLQEKLRSLPNVDIYTNHQTTEVVGKEGKVVALKVQNRESDSSFDIDLSGVFVQIGLSPNSSVFADIVPVDNRGQVIVDESCRTQTPGVYAAGDVSTVPYKQIIIAMGEGAKAALSAFDDLIRNV